jgi:hypothetical protein
MACWEQPCWVKERDMGMVNKIWKPSVRQFNIFPDNISARSSFHILGNVQAPLIGFTAETLIHFKWW